jgi:hypothetical protein
LRSVSARAAGHLSAANPCGDGPRGVEVPSSLQMRERKRAAPPPSKEDDTLAPLRKRAAVSPAHLVVQLL